MEKTSKNQTKCGEKWGIDQYSAPRVTIARPIPMKMTMKTPPMLWIEIPPLLSSASSHAWSHRYHRQSGNYTIINLLLRILIPPSLFQCLQFPLVQQLQYPKKNIKIISPSIYFHSVACKRCFHISLGIWRDCNLRIVELVFERASLLDCQSVRLPTEFISNPEKDLEEKGQKWTTWGTRTNVKWGQSKTKE